jgi:hypothetical protein
VQHVLERTRQSIELPDDDRVALAQMVEQAMQLRPLFGREVLDARRGAAPLSSHAGRRAMGVRR